MIVPIVPVARCPVAVRVAGPGDLPFIDALQKMHTHMVGWFPSKQLEASIAGGHILIAEEGREPQRHRGAETTELNGSNIESPSVSQRLCGSNQLGYCIAKDHYMGRDDVGIIYQLNVMPLRQRHLIGATLVKACFERAAYGCRLYCCWCAQDIQANWFWESVGFVPLAFRAGSRGKQRVHIFWPRRVREGDEGPGATAYWFPSQTHAGAVREDRIVLPIPPGTHWRDAKPVVLPGVPGVAAGPVAETPLTLPGGSPVRPRPEQPRVTTSRKMAIVRSQSRRLQGLPPGKAAIMSAGGVRYIERGDYVPEQEAPKPKRVSKPRAKNDPQHVAAARELRDRFLEKANSDPGFLLPQGKYDVSRQLASGAATPRTELKQTPLLKAA